MSDGSAATMFGEILALLAEYPTDEHKKIARRIFSYTGNFDFDYYEMGADEAGLALGLARRGIDERYPEDGVTVLWGDQ